MTLGEGLIIFMTMTLYWCIYVRNSTAIGTVRYDHLPVPPKFWLRPEAACLPVEPPIRTMSHLILHQPDARRRSRQWTLLGPETAPGPIIIVSALAAVGLFDRMWCLLLPAHGEDVCGVSSQKIGAFSELDRL